MLLPEATKPGQPSRLWVAVCREGGEQVERVVGAAALGPDGQAGAGRGWQVDCRVIVPYRRRGIGRTLIEHAVGVARGHGVSALHAWGWFEPDSEVARAWSAFDFAPCRHKTEFESDLAKHSAMIRPLLDEVREHGWIPESARVVPLAEADLEAVARLHVQYLGGNRRLLMPLLRGTAPDRYDPVLSRVLLLDGQVVGFTLGRIFPGGVCEVDANVVHPSLRLGWANLLLKLEATDRLLEAGVHTIRFFALDQHTDTRRLSRKVGAKVVRVLQQMRRDLGPPPAPPAGGGGAGA